MLFRLVILNGPKSGKRITVPASAMVIGRGEDCDVVLDDSEVAYEHLEIRMEESALYLRDLGSMVGTLVNQVQTRAGRLKHGDIIEVGRTRFLVEAHVQAEVPVERNRGSVFQRRMKRGIGVALVILAVGLTLLWRFRAVPEPREEAFRASPVLPSASNVSDSLKRGEDSVSEELRLLRGDLEAIRKAVSTLSTTGVETNGGREDPSGTRRDEAVLALLERASTALDEGRLSDAERLLQGLQVLAPENIPGLKIYARLYERNGMLHRAADTWNRIQEQAQDSALRVRAREEQARIARRQREIEAASASVSVATLQQRKFPVRDGIEEMRTVTVGLVPETPDARPDPSDVLVEVAFYDRALPAGVVFPSQRVGPVRVQPKGEWAPGEQKEVVATYRVDRRSPRPGARMPSGPRIAFVGYRVRLFVRGHLKREVFRPVTLSDLSDTREASVRPAAASVPGETGNR